MKNRKKETTGNDYSDSAKYALLFEAEKNTISQTTATAMRILGLLLLVIVFILGYVLGKVKKKENSNEG